MPTDLAWKMSCTGEVNDKIFKSLSLHNFCVHEECMALWSG